MPSYLCRTVVNTSSAYGMTSAGKNSKDPGRTLLIFLKYAIRKDDPSNRSNGAFIFDVLNALMNDLVTRVPQRRCDMLCSLVFFLTTS